MKRGENTSRLIDRLVLGQPRPDVVIQRTKALLSNGWLASEIAPLFALTTDALLQRLARHRRSERAR